MKIASRAISRQRVCQTAVFQPKIAFSNNATTEVTPANSTTGGKKLNLDDGLTFADFLSGG